MPSLSSLVTTAAPSINSDSTVEWGVRNIIPIVLLFIGIAIVAGVRTGHMGQNAMTVTNVMLPCIVIAGAALFYGFAARFTPMVLLCHLRIIHADYGAPHARLVWPN